MPAKRAFDIAFSAVALAAGAPLFALVALAVWLDSGRPIFYSQSRVGRNFRTFRIWKFRSMLRDAAGANITVAGDNRVTRVGRILRATKVDELPQFWNVLRGDMSVVGPRPELPEFVRRFRARYAQVLEVRPGITDPASVRFRDEERILALCRDPQAYYLETLLPMKLELAEIYVGNRSFAADLRVLLDTIIATLFRA